MRSWISQWLRYNAIFPLFSRLPAELGYKGAGWVSRRDFEQNQTLRDAYIHGLSAAFPEYDHGQLVDSAQKYFAMMTREMLDVYRIPRLSKHNVSQHVDLEGLELLQEAQKQGRGVIVVMGHYGRPIMLSTVLGLVGEKLSILTQGLDEENQNLHPAEKAYLEFKIKRTIDVSNGNCFMRGDGMRPLYRALNAGEAVAILCDIYEPNSRRQMLAPFRGGNLSIASGIPRAAASTGARLIYGSVRDEGARVKVTLRELTDDPEIGFFDAVKELEKDIEAAPWQWWKWPGYPHMWSEQASRDVA